MDNMPPKYTRTKDLTPEQIEAKDAETRKYKREWARKNEDKRWARMKERMAADPEYRAEYLRKVAEANAKRRKKLAENETPEAREKRLQRNREYDAKKRREWRLANPIAPKEPKPKAEKKPKAPPVSNFKRKPGRLLSLMGWRGF